MIDILSWAINIGALAAWLINIKYRKAAMILFTCVTIPSIVYFALTNQAPFVFRSLFYLAVNIATLIHIFKHETKPSA